MAITSAVEAIEHTSGGTLPEEVVKFVAESFGLSEFSKGQTFEWRKHLFFLNGNVQEYLLIGIHQHGVFAKIVPV